MSNPKIDVLYVVALEEEKTNIAPRLPDGSIPQKVGDYPLHINIDNSLPTKTLVHAFWIAWDMGPEEILLELPNLIRSTSPSLVVNVGIAGMFSSDARIGDVVVASTIDYYIYRGAIDDADRIDQAIQLGGKHVPCHQSTWKQARHSFEQHPEDWQSIQRNFEHFCKQNTITELSQLTDKKLLNNPLKIHFGSICSGPFVSRSNIFKEKLLRKRDRNFLCIEMEAAGVAMVMNRFFPETPFLVVKGISDPGDSNKPILDSAMKGKNRILAVQNAFDMALRFVWRHFKLLDRQHHASTDVSAPSLQQSIVHNVIKWFLPQPYKLLAQERANRVPSYYSEISRAVTLSQCQESETPVTLLAGVLAKQIDKSVAYVTGRPGTGKTSLLCLIYLYCLRKWELGESKAFPVLIGIRPSIGFWSEQKVEIEQTEQLERIESITEQLKELQRKEPNLPLIILFDTGEAEDSFVNHIRKTIRDLALSLRSAALMSGRNRKTAFGVNPPDQQFSLLPCPRNKESIERFVSAFFSLIQKSDASKHARSVVKALWESGLEEVDLFDANVAVQLSEAESSFGFRHEAFALEGYSRLRLQQLGINEAELSTYMGEAARFALLKEQRMLSETAVAHLSHPARALARAHPRIHDYLIAQLLINELASYNGTSAMPECLNRVYPQRINRIAKELMCTNGKEKKCVDNIILLEEKKPSFKAKAFLSYLLGRTKHIQLRERAKEHLSRCLEEARMIHEVAGDSQEDHEACLYARTVYISLAYLGDNVAKQEYVNLLITNKQFDEINRGFHLEYFGDQKYEINLPLQNRDLLRDCPLTYERLAARLSNDELSPMFEIELQTLCSLALRRHAQGCLSPEFHERSTAILNSSSLKAAVKNPALTDYLLTVEWCLKENPLCAVGLFVKFRKIKEQPRMGWIVRGINPCESVGDHIVVTGWLGQWFLPEKHKDKRYDKSRILKMISIHDMAEAITGDKLPTEKGESEQESEMRVFRQTKHVDLILGLTNQQEALELFQEFEARDTINARVARDLDKIEMLIQLHCYADSGKRVADYAELVRELDSKVETEIGRDILGHVRAWRKLLGNAWKLEYDES